MTVALAELLEDDPMTGRPRGFKKTFDEVMDIAALREIRGIVIGASALASHGAPRYSEDIDLLAPHAEARRLVRYLIDAGWKGPLPSADVFFYTMTSPGGVPVDVMGGIEPLYIEAINNAEEAVFLGRSILVPTPEFYVLLKLKAADSSPLDKLKHLSDIVQLLRAKPDTDLGFVDTFVTHNEPELRSVFGELLKHVEESKHPGKGRRRHVT